MELQVSGKLTSGTDEQPSFQGCRVTALFDQKCVADSNAPSTLSDAAGNFTLKLPHKQEIAGKLVKFVVSSPAGRTIGEMEVMKADLGHLITIEVTGFESTTHDKPAPQLKTPLRAAIDVAFHHDTSVRQALTENLKPLRVESEAIAGRVQQAFANFNPRQLSAKECERRHYVEPGADPGEVLNSVIMSGVEAFRSSNTGRAITLRKTPELQRLIKEAPEPMDSLEGVVDLDALVSHINRMGTGSSLMSEPVFTHCKAELEAETILGAAEKPKNANGGSVANPDESPSGTREAERLVKESVNLQMKSATAPESRLEYAYIPNSAEKDKVQNAILQTFQLRPGPTDVTSYHDFHTLQIAFAHVWTEIFDGQLTSLGRELYQKYVKLKDFSGSTQPDLQVGTLHDLRRLMGEVKKLSQIVQEDLPSDLRGGTGDTENGSQGGLSLDVGEKPQIQWSQFPGPFPGNSPKDRIVKRIDQNVAPDDYVQIKLEWQDSSLWKGIAYQEFDSNSGSFINVFKISNNSRDSDLWDPDSPHMLTLATSRLSIGQLEFMSQEVEGGVRVEGAGGHRGRYLLGNLHKELPNKSRVTFNWIAG
jgi:hypothetical protein